jgi:hypothetical protein
LRSRSNIDQHLSHAKTFQTSSLWIRRTQVLFEKVFFFLGKGSGKGQGSRTSRLRNQSPSHYPQSILILSLYSKFRPSRCINCEKMLNRWKKWKICLKSGGSKFFPNKKTVPKYLNVLKSINVPKFQNFPKILFKRNQTEIINVRVLKFHTIFEMIFYGKTICLTLRHVKYIFLQVFEKSKFSKTLYAFRHNMISFYPKSKFWRNNHF